MKQDYFSANNIKYIDYKDIEILKKFLNPNGKIVSHKRSGVTSKNQRALASAIKHAHGFTSFRNKIKDSNEKRRCTPASQMSNVFFCPYFIYTLST